MRRIWTIRFLVKDCAVTNLQLINKIFAEKRFDLLRPVALPYFEAHVL